MIALSHLSEPVEEDLSVSVVLVLRWIFILCASILQVRMSPIFLLPGLRALSDAVLRNLSCSWSRLEPPFLVRLRRSVGAGGNFKAAPAPSYRKAEKKSFVLVLRMDSVQFKHRSMFCNNYF